MIGTTLKEQFVSVARLVYPKLCCACGDALMTGEEFLCLNCKLELPQTNYHLQPENRMEKMFWGRVRVEKAAAFLYFHKSGLTQQLMHNIKYHGVKKAMYFIGEWYARNLKDTFNVDAIVPVPLHKSKERRRGFNQSEWFAKGLSPSLNAPVISNSIIRTVKTKTQTRKSREQRLENVKGIFSVIDPGSLNNKHLLIVDDVVTTGATLEAIVNEIFLSTQNVKISIATAAVAS